MLKNEYMLLCLLLMVSFVIRVMNLDAISLWVDEFVHISHAQRIINDGAPIFGVDDNGILYTLFVLPFFLLFEETAFWARFPSVMFGVGSIWVIWMLAKELYNKPVAFITSIITAFSVYHVFWSRLSRNYSIFCFFFLLLVYILFKVTSTLKRKESLQIQHLIFLGIAFVAALLSHLLTVVILFSLAIYFITEIALDVKSTKRLEPSKVMIGLGLLVLMIMVLTPVLSGFFNSFLSLFLPEHVVGMISLDWDRIRLLWDKEPLSAFLTFWDVFYADQSYVIILGIAGLFLSFLWNKEHARYHLFVFMVPLLLMSFIFREPNEPRYLLFIYPLFLIYIGVTVVTIVNAVIDLINAEAQNKRSIKNLSYGIIIVVLIASAGNLSQIKSIMYADQRTGNIVNQKLSSWFFVNWKDVYEKAKSNIKKEDIVFSTVPAAARFYLDHERVFSFRQFRYSGESNRYIMNDYSSESISAATLSNLEQTVNNYQRGWLFANYYLYNVVTDPAARKYIYSNFNFNYDLSTEVADVQVFNWDNNIEGPEKQNVVVHLGKYRRNSENFNFEVQNDSSEKFISVRYADNDYLGEAYIIINNNFDNAIPIPPNKTDAIEQIRGKIDNQLLRLGNNTVRFYYNHQDSNEGNSGYVVYQLKVEDE